MCVCVHAQVHFSLLIVSMTSVVMERDCVWEVRCVDNGNKCCFSTLMGSSSRLCLALPGSACLCLCEGATGRHIESVHRQGQTSASAKHLLISSLFLPTTTTTLELSLSLSLSVPLSRFLSFSRYGCCGLCAYDWNQHIDNRPGCEAQD